MATPITDTKKTTATAKPGKRTHWRVLGEHVHNYLVALKKLQAIAKLAPPPGHEVAWKKLAHEISEDDGNGHAIFDQLVAMDAARVPLAKVPQPQPFESGDIVAVRKEHLSKYDTFFGHDDLQDLKVVRVSKDGKQYLCAIDEDGVTGDTVQIVRASHLRKVER